MSPQSISSEHIEGAVAADLVAGYPDGTYQPNRNISRQNVNTILGRYLEKQELAQSGHIQGDLGAYPTIEDWYAAEGQQVLASFADQGQVAPLHTPYTAYLVYRGVVQGSPGAGGLYLLPLSEVTRAQAACLVLRAAAE